MKSAAVDLFNERLSRHVCNILRCLPCSRFWRIKFLREINDWWWAAWTDSFGKPGRFGIVHGDDKNGKRGTNQRWVENSHEEYRRDALTNTLQATWRSHIAYKCDPNKLVFSCNELQLIVSSVFLFKMIGLINWRSTATKIYLTSCWHSTFQPVPKPGRVPQTTWFEAKTSSCVGPKHGPSLCFVKVQSNHLWGEDLWIFDVGKCVKKRNKDDFLHCVQKDSTWCSISGTMIKSIAALRSPKSLKAQLITKVAEAHQWPCDKKRGDEPHPNSGRLQGRVLPKLDVQSGNRPKAIWSEQGNWLWKSSSEGMATKMT